MREAARYAAGPTEGEGAVDGFLERAVAQAHERVAEAARLVEPAALEASARRRPAGPSLAAALSHPGTSVIAEVKRASPSAGHLAWVPDPVALARSYLTGGAAALSVLTEPAHFRGSLADLDVVAAGVAAPAIRKDFVVDAYQVWEARMAGAAAVLLIVAALEHDRLVDLLGVCAEAGLEPLIEVHDAAEAARATQALAAAGPTRRIRPIVGVNARDLVTLEIDPARFGACVEALPDGAIRVAESGVGRAQDVTRAREAGADAVLVGSHLVTAADPAATVRSLVEAGRG